MLKGLKAQQLLLDKPDILVDQIFNYKENIKYTTE